MIAVFFAAVLVLAGADQLTKFIAVSKLIQGQPLRVISAGDLEILTFSLYRNTGAAFSSFEGKTFMLTVTTVVFMAAIFFYVIKFRPKSKILLICLMLIAGGGIGNLIDRIRLS